jgi:hypothetical protein
MVGSCALSHNNFSNLRTMHENQIKESNCCLNPSPNIVLQVINYGFRKFNLRRKRKTIECTNS